MEDGFISRSPGSWSYVLPCDPETGKKGPKWITIHGTKTDAKRAKRNDLVWIEKGLFPPELSKMTLSEYRAYFLDIIKTKRYRTYNSYVSAFNAFGKCLETRSVLSDVTTDAVQRAVNELSSRLEKSSVNLYFTKIKTAFKHAVKLKYISSNPCDDVIVAKPDPAEKAVWDIQQQNVFIKFFKATTLRYAALFVLLLKSGARIGEVLALRWSDVDLDAWIIHITRTVSGKGYGPPKSKNGVRKIPLSEGTVKMLSKHKVQQGKEKLLFGEGYNPENLVFCKENGKRLPYEDARYFFECFCKHAELPYIKPHGLRHTHATMLLMNGHSVNAVAERLGDDPETIMKTYAHVLPGMQKEMVKTIEQLYDDEISK